MDAPGTGRAAPALVARILTGPVHRLGVACEVAVEVLGARRRRVARCQAGAVRHVLVSFHAHPDDEALLTGGTLARLAAEGHRVVLVVATDGAAGLADDTRDLGARRAAELADSARALGVARVVRLGHPDSGWGSGPAPHRPGPGPVFSELPVEDVARELAAVLREEDADAVTVYDPAGGYGHPDHVHVHRCGVRAAELAGTPLVLEATVDRSLVLLGLRLAHLVPGLVSDLRADALREAFSPRAAITHRIDVRAQLPAKRAALAAHLSQAEAARGLRGIGLLLRLPGPVARWALGREWFVERGRPPGRRPSGDLLASLGPAGRDGGTGGP